MNPPPPHPSYQKISSSPILQTTSLWFLNRKAAFTDSMAQKRNPHNPPFREPEAIVKSQQPRTDTEPWGGGGIASGRVRSSWRSEEDAPDGEEVEEVGEGEGDERDGEGEVPAAAACAGTGAAGQVHRRRRRRRRRGRGRPAPLDAVNISPPSCRPLARLSLSPARSFVGGVYWGWSVSCRVSSRLPLYSASLGALLCFALLMLGGGLDQWMQFGKNNTSTNNIGATN